MGGAEIGARGTVHIIYFDFLWLHNVFLLLPQIKRLREEGLRKVQEQEELIKAELATEKSEKRNVQCFFLFSI